MANWFLLRAGQAHGPYPEEQIREWIRMGQLTAEDWLCREGENQWRRVREIPDFAVAGPIPGNVAPSSFGTPSAPSGSPNPPKDKLLAGLLAIFLGGLGVHHFYLGNITIGVIYLLLACVGISPILGLIDGIIYLVRSEEEFQRNYRNWFCSGSLP